MKEERITARTIFTTLVWSATALVLSPLPASSVGGDDVFLLTTSVAPNVVMIFDNSDSMAHIEWHPEFDIEGPVPTCTAFDNDTEYVAADLRTGGNPASWSDTHCGNTRTIWDPASSDAKSPEAWWHGRYLNWYFSDAADPYVNEIETATIADFGCQKAGEFPDRYRRTRGQAMKETLLTVVCIAEGLNVRFGMSKFRERDDTGGVDPNGGYIMVELQRANPNHAAELESAIKNTVMGSSTPLAEALFQTYTYYMGRTPAGVPFGADGLTKFPYYEYKEVDGSREGVAARWLPDPIQYSCQKSYVILVTDGEPKHDDFDADPPDTALGFGDFGVLIGDYHVDGETEMPGDADESGFYLDDIAKYMQDKDFRPDFGDDQTIDTYVVGFSTNVATNTFLERTADLGNGLFFHAKDGEALAFALIAALNDIIEKSRSFTASTVQSARTVDGGAFFNSFFLPTDNTAFWQGHMRAWTIDAVGDIRDKNGACALEDPDPGECNSGVFKPICVGAPAADCAIPFWDASDEVPAVASRDLYASKLVSGTPARVDFDDTLQAADLDISAFVAAGNPTPNSALYPIRGSTAINEEGLADEVVAFTRGCAFGTGVTSADVGTPTACSQRLSRLADIFHSDPLVIQTPPIRSLLGTSYDAFRTAYLHRKRVIYAGTNGGFLHAFQAGTWDTSRDPDTYNEGTGEEIFGFMPWQARKKIKNLPIDSPTARNHYVDGPPQSANVWLYPTATTSAKAANGSEWRTLLAGGLRGGGNQFYAVDVTNPDNIVGPTGGSLPYPGYLWEFPDENDTSGDLANMGQTWGQPIITRVKVKVGANDNSGNGFDRWVAIVTGGYDPTGDPNPVEVTGEASATYVDTATAGRGIYLIDMKTGKVLAEQKFNSTGSNCPTATAGTPQQNMCFAIPSAPSVLDLDFDGYADVIFAGDLGGNLWKWVISPIGEDRVNDGSGLRTQPSWKFRRLFRAPVTTISGTDYYKNFYFPPAASFISSRLWLAFGSGEREHVGYAGDGTADDPDSRDENNRFYVMSDLDPYETLVTPQAELDESDLTDISGTQSGAVITGRGYYFKGQDGEKFVTRSDIFTGQVIVSSFEPVSTGDPCTSRGNATLYIFELGTGDGYFHDNNGDPIRSTSIGSGFPTDPKVSIGVGGEDTRVFIEKSGADLESLDAPDVPTGGSYLYWREMN